MSGIPAWCVRGAKVVCIRDFGEATVHDDRGYSTKPALHEIYTIRLTDLYWGVATVTLEEFEDDHYFDLRGFRPAVPPRTLAEDVAKFNDLLIPDKELSDA